MKLQGQHAVVTGSTSGIGRAIAELFAREGARVVVTGRDAARGQEVVDAIRGQGGEAMFVQADLTEEADAVRLVDAATKAYGPVDILVNNAGAVYAGTIPETDLATWNRILHTNVTSAYLMCRLVVPGMVERGAGSIINIGSEVALKGVAKRAAYAAAKAALVGLTRALVADHSPQGVRVNCICPGTIETPLVRQLIAAHPEPEKLRQEMISRRFLPFIGTPEEVAAAALYLASPEARYVTGAILAIDGGGSIK